MQATELCSSTRSASCPRAAGQTPARAREREFQRVGETQQRFSVPGDCATNRDLRQEVRKGNFRADLYHRLSVFTIEVPSLREMDEDRALLLEHYRKFYADRRKLARSPWTKRRQKAWHDYHFPATCASCATSSSG